MNLVMAAFASILLSTFGSASAEKTKESCILNNGERGVGWLIRIYRGKDTSSHGALVTANRVLSVFSPYITVAYDKTNKEAQTYDFVAYSNSRSGGYCYQTRKANKIIPPPEWKPSGSFGVTGRPFELVGRDLAFWEISQDFDVYLLTFQFLFPKDDDVTGISSAISSTKIGTKCNLTTFATRSTFLTGFTKNREVSLSSVDSCETSYCAVHLCDLSNRYDYCTEETRNTDIDAWERGAVLTCNGAQIAILALNGNKPKTIGRNLFINLLTAWDVFKRKPNPRPTGETVTTTTTEIRTTGSDTSQSTTLDTTTALKTTAILKTTAAPSTNFTITPATNVTNTTAPWVITTKIPAAPTQAQSATTEKPPFVRTIPQHAKPASGSTLVPHTGALLGLTAIAIIRTEIFENDKISHA